MAPWVAIARHRASEDGDPNGDKILDCTYCQERLTDAQRAKWGCGHLSERLRTGRDYKRIAGAPEPPECPGYLIGLPEIAEANRALKWAERGDLRNYLFGAEYTQAVVDAVDILRVEADAAQSHSLRERSKGVQR
jgi:hypothetical protein